MAGDAEKLDAGSDPSYDLTHTRRNRNRHTRLLGLIAEIQFPRMLYCESVLKRLLYRYLMPAVRPKDNPTPTLGQKDPTNPARNM